MEFEINVSLNGQHLFFVGKEDLSSIGNVVKLFRLLDEKFIDAEGYDITVMVSCIESQTLFTDDFRKLVRDGAAKGFLISLQSKFRKCEIVQDHVYSHHQQCVILERLKW